MTTAFFRSHRNTIQIARLIIVIIALLILISGVTFAALQSQQAKITGNSIQTATANLQIGQDGNTYSNSLSGFAFSNLVPGGQAMPLNGYSVYVKNSGGTPLALKLSVSSTPLNPDNVDLNKVHILLIPMDGGSMQNFTLQNLISSNSTGGTPITVPSQLMPGVATQYKIQVSMELDAVSGSSASINNVDFSFSGLAL